MAHHYSAWYNLDYTSYRSVPIYESMKWGNTVARFDTATVAASTFAGPIAVAQNRDESGTQLRSFPITIHTGNGQIMGRIQWSGGELLHLAWTCREELLVLTKEGKAVLYSLFGVERRGAAFSMGQEVSEMGGVSAATFEAGGGTGLAVLAASHRLFLVSNVEDPKVWRSAEIPRRVAEAPSAWTVFEREAVVRVVFVLGAEIYVMSKGVALPELVAPAVSQSVARYTHVSASPDGTKLAFLSQNGLVQILSADMKHAVVEADSGLRTRPESVLWVGSEAVALRHAHTLTLIGVEGGSLDFIFDEAVHVAQEWDGVRVLSPSAHNFIEEVPKPVQNVYQVASRAPGAMLLESNTKYKEGSHMAYEYRRVVDRRLGEAVAQCVAAAAAEWDRGSQAALLEAASFGAAFTSADNPRATMDTKRRLRALNAVRERSFGIPMSWAQLQRLTEGVLLDRLIGRAQWPLAMAIAADLRLPPAKGIHRVLAHWAARLIQTEGALPGDQRHGNAVVADKICERFSEFPGISFADVASKAAKAGLKELANILLEKEPELVRQVNLLLRLENHPKALSKATQSGDPDLIYFVILELKRKMNRSEFLLALRKFPLAFALYKQMCKGESAEQLKALYKQEDDFLSLALAHLRDAANSDAIFDVLEKQGCLAQAVGCLNAAKEEFLGTQVSEQMRLLKTHVDLEEQLPGQPFIDKPLRDTIVALVALVQRLRPLSASLICPTQDHGGKAEALRKEFRIAERTWWWWKAEGLAKAGKWSELEAFARSKKSPIGYVPFVDLAARYGAKAEAQKFLSRLAPDEKVKGLVKIGLLFEAAKVALEQGDENGLNHVLARCGQQNRALSEQVVEMRKTLRAKKK